MHDLTLCGLSIAFPAALAPTFFFGLVYDVASILALL